MRITVSLATALVTALSFAVGAQVPSRPDSAKPPLADTVAPRLESSVIRLDTAGLRSTLQQIDS